MKELIFATGNPHKLEEVAQLLKQVARIRGLQELGFNDELPEDHNTLEGNALQKARTLYQHLQQNCFADDTGLEVYALNMEPGVRSARYADAPSKSDKANLEKLLSKMQGQKDRRARFRTVIALILDGKEHLFEGIVEGQLIQNPRGTQGFGYDPVFIPQGHKQTFAEMSLTQKNAISHRFRAIQKMKNFLSQL